MEIVYTNRRANEERVHIELDAEEIAALAQGDPECINEFRGLVGEADRRLNPPAPAAQS